VLYTSKNFAATGQVGANKQEISEVDRGLQRAAFYLLSMSMSAALFIALQHGPLTASTFASLVAYGLTITDLAPIRFGPLRSRRRA
jgi:hypothetical protein